MQVLRYGNTYKEIECDECGALLSYCIKDIQSYTSTDFYNSKIHYSEGNYIVCPECKHRIVLKYYIDGIEIEYPYIKIK